MLVTRSVQIALDADVYYRRHVNSGLSHAAAKHASRVNWGRKKR